MTEWLRAAPSRIERVLIDREARGLDAVEALARSAGVRVERVAGARLAQVAPEGLCRGVVAVGDPPPLHDVEDLADAAAARPGRSVLAALDGVEDPRNLGAIIRSAEFFGAVGVVWARDRAARLSPAAVRASAGASERVPLCVVTNLVRALAACKDRGLWVVGTVVDGGEPLRELAAADRLPEHLVVVLGGEHGGLRRLVRERCDFLATIGGAGGVGSLNVSAAAAVTFASLA